jgi:2-keto-3-deoxy-L-rhamnonate aldolase RhmA
MGIPQQYDHPDFIAVKQMIAEAASKAGKAAGTLLMTPDQIESTVAHGYSFIALDSDGGAVANGMQQIASAFDPFRR